jgi:hypothetical protein
MIGFGLNNGLQAKLQDERETALRRLGNFSQGVYIAISIAAIELLTWFLAPVILKQVIHEPGGRKINPVLKD